MSESGQGAHDLNRIDPSTAEAAPPVDVERIAAAVREILAAIGEDPERDGLKDTPARVARMYACAEFCGSCGFELRGLANDADGCRVCPECGAAWRIN